MVLTVYHLKASQSERIAWLLEELNLPYELHVFPRNKTDNLAPPEIKNLSNNPLQSAPVFIDSESDAQLVESGAIVQYILAKYAPTSPLGPGPDSPIYATYLDWLHRANATVMPSIFTGLVLRFTGHDPADLPEGSTQARLMKRMNLMLSHAETTLAASKWLAGDTFTAADIMLHFCYVGMRYFLPFSLAGYPHILRWTRDCQARPAFRRAFEKGDPEQLAMLPFGEVAPTEEHKFWRK